MSFASFGVVALGGAIGAVFRYLVYLAVKEFKIESFIATLCVNLIGVALISIFSRQDLSLSPLMTSFLKVGVVAALTTYSTFIMDAVTLAQGQRWGVLGLYLAGQMIIGPVLYILFSR